METKLRKIRNEDEISKLLILGKNPDVDSLSFRDCHLAARGGIPQFLSTFTHLKSLDLKNNLLNDLPSFFSCLTSLTFIHLGLNRITRLDPLEKLPNLTNICLNNNRFNNFPPEVFKFTHLKVLDLSKNDISQIPTEIVRLSNLEELFLYSNRITQIPDCLTSLTKLHKLILIQNNFAITKLPDYLVKMTNLDYLTLSQNRFTEFPKDFKNMTRLRILHFGDAALTTFPPDVVHLTNLTSIGMSSNHGKTFLPCIPQEFVNLTKLTNFWAREVYFDIIPNNFKEMFQLERYSFNAKKYPPPKFTTQFKLVESNFSELRDFLTVQDDLFESDEM